MNKTLKMLNIIHKHKKIKATYINWKTFNAKQTWIHMPKMLNLLKKINNTMLTSINKKIKMQKLMLTNAVVQAAEHTFVQKNEKLTYNLKTNAYQSMYRTVSYAHDNIKQNLNIHKIKHKNINIEYYIYILLIHMLHNLKKTKIAIVTLPRKRTAYTVLKSPHADKKSREQFMKELFNVHISIQHYISVMKFINNIVLSYTKSFMHSYKYNAFAENKI